MRTLRKVSDLLIVLAFIFVIVPVYLAVTTKKFVEQHVIRYTPFRILATTTVVTALGITVATQVKSQMPSDPGKYEVLCNGVYSCGYGPDTDFVVSAGVVLLALVAILRLASYFTDYNARCEAQQ